MASRAHIPRVSARIGALIVQVAAARGVDAQRLMAGSGFDPRWLVDAEARMPLAVAERLWDRAAELAADPGLSRNVTAHAEQLLAALAPAAEMLTAQVRRQLTEGMANEPMTLSQVARRLHLSERSLQRRLEAEGTRFAQLVDEVRRELALRYIADERLAPGEVAYLLGFAEPSPFHRAFKRWTGTTPLAARRARH